ncbi:response regulator with CheY-like receiver domain and winged-helix DNA-binding domain [Desulfitobacterium dichloroeliminans LMG P-21439]|uniref:Stage 0 sporulation protein A homolog n=1 Tax=Desulfitobacterium dichloroeliminans (strain LMG P-21439 / DCA1) TaxID=871963 RepID=L0F7M0_DESDL|nr:response regulator transcription factor [Desulfitobacterium dichloroeliminans]AGA68646.1 response regulator with CheY-like receiver domain and winged-helix DNA-binding domain [Desulfitobacterium dichloroeliminans LMG P-21439]
MRILVVDDDERIREIVRLYLEAEGYEIEEAENGNSALERVRNGAFDLIVLDLMIPGLDGWTVCKILRKETQIPIIMLTAKGEENDRILGFDLGADDYVVKPFSPRELNARVKAVLRRLDGEQSKDHLIIFPGFTINQITREIVVEGKEVKLTAKEFDLLLVLAKYPSRIFTRDQLLNSVWDFDYCGDSRTVDTHINRLRSKFDSQVGYSDFIQTVRGVGYKFEFNGH